MGLNSHEKKSELFFCTLSNYTFLIILSVRDTLDSITQICPQVRLLRRSGGRPKRRTGTSASQVRLGRLPDRGSSFSVVATTRCPPTALHSDGAFANRKKEYARMMNEALDDQQYGGQFHLTFAEFGDCPDAVRRG